MTKRKTHWQSSSPPPQSPVVMSVSLLSKLFVVLVCILPFATSRPTPDSSSASEVCLEPLVAFQERGSNFVFGTGLSFDGDVVGVGSLGFYKLAPQLLLSSSSSSSPSPLFFNNSSTNDSSTIILDDENDNNNNNNKEEEGTTTLIRRLGPHSLGRGLRQVAIADGGNLLAILVGRPGCYLYDRRRRFETETNNNNNIDAFNVTSGGLPPDQELRGPELDTLSFGEAFDLDVTPDASRVAVSFEDNAQVFRNVAGTMQGDNNTNNIRYYYEPLGRPLEGGPYPSIKLSSSGDFLAFGERRYDGDDNQVRLRIFYWNGTEWETQADILGNENTWGFPKRYQFFSLEMSFNANATLLAVTSMTVPEVDVANSTAISFFARAHDGVEWHLDSTLVTDRYARPINLSKDGRLLVAGFPYRNTTSGAGGRVVLYHQSSLFADPNGSGAETKWSAIQTIEADQYEEAQFGRGLAFNEDDSRLAVTSNRNNVGPRFEVYSVQPRMCNATDIPTPPAVVEVSTLPNETRCVAQIAQFNTSSVITRVSMSADVVSFEVPEGPFGPSFVEVYQIFQEADDDSNNDDDTKSPALNRSLLEGNFSSAGRTYTVLTGQGTVLAVSERRDTTVRFYYRSRNNFGGSDAANSTGGFPAFADEQLTLSNNNTFGLYMAMNEDGTLLCVHQQGRDEYGVATNLVQAYRRHDSAPTPWQAVGGPIVQGTHLSLSKTGAVLIVGVYTEDRIRIFRYDDERNDWHLEADMVGEEFSEFGAATAVNADGTVVAVAAPFAATDGWGVKTGVVHLYYASTSMDLSSQTGNTATTWEHGHTVAVSSVDSFFGDTVELSGDGKSLLVSNVRGDYTTIQLFVYVEQSNRWERLFQDQHGENPFALSLGSALAMNEDGSRFAAGTYTSRSYVQNYIRVYEITDCPPATTAETGATSSPEFPLSAGPTLAHSAIPTEHPLSSPSATPVSEPTTTLNTTNPTSAPVPLPVLPSPPPSEPSATSSGTSLAFRFDQNMLLAATLLLFPVSI